jgi:hypothetical protein
MWIHAPFTQLTAFLQHYLHCKQLSLDITSACMLVPGYLLPMLKSLVSGMRLFKRYSKGVALFEHTSRTGSSAPSAGLAWPVYVLTDALSDAAPVLEKGDALHRLHNATVKNRYPLPRLDDLFDKLFGAQYLSCLDAASVFHQILLRSENKPKTAFRTPLVITSLGYFPLA